MLTGWHVGSEACHVQISLVGKGTTGARRMLRWSSPSPAPLIPGLCIPWFEDGPDLAGYY